MKKISILLSALFISTQFAFAQGSSIEVIGEAEVAVEATGLLVEVSILTKEGSAEKALKETSDAVEDIVEYIFETPGIAKLATTGVSIEAEWNKKEEEYEYISVQTLTIRIDSILGYDEIMQDLAGKGINQISNITYLVEDEAGVRKALLAQAVANAKEKAEIIAKKSGTRVGGKVNVVEQTTENDLKLMKIIGELENSFVPSKVIIKSSVLVSYNM
tara:strand:- start:70 stop:720 length:651 start_codon:yes stop_codon:yes gene_type:complete